MFKPYVTNCIVEGGWSIVCSSGQERTLCTLDRWHYLCLVQILEDLLNVEKCPRKPQYSMASGILLFYSLLSSTFLCSSLTAVLLTDLWHSPVKTWLHVMPDQLWWCQHRAWKFCVAVCSVLQFMSFIHQVLVTWYFKNRLNCVVKCNIHM